MFPTAERWREEVREDLAEILGDSAGEGRRDGDRETAWRHLLEVVRAHATELARRAYHLPWEDAEDIAQVVQIRVSERLLQLRRMEAFPAWVRKLVHRAILDARRKRRPTVPLDAVQLPPAAVDDSYDRVLLRVDLDRALARLPELYREPIRLHVLQGVPQAEVGRLLDRPRSTVATQIERGLSRLRRELTRSAAATR